MLIFFILMLLFIFFPSINGLFDILLGLFFNRTTQDKIITCRTKRTLFFLGSWAKSPRIRQSGNQLFLSSDSKYILREATC